MACTMPRTKLAVVGCIPLLLLLLLVVAAAPADAKPAGEDYEGATEFVSSLRLRFPIFFSFLFLFCRGGVRGSGEETPVRSARDCNL